MTWRYGRIDGHVMPVEMTSTGRVRMIGQSTFKMSYDYLSIQGQPTGGRLNAALTQKH